MAHDRSLRLLVVEDEGLLAMMLIDMLEDLGHRVVRSAASVDQALLAIADGPTDLDGCVLDANLGGHSSTPIAEALRRARIPFFITSGYGSADLHRAGLTERAIGKPYNMRELAAALARL